LSGRAAVPTRALPRALSARDADARSEKTLNSEKALRR